MSLSSINPNQLKDLVDQRKKRIRSKNIEDKNYLTIRAVRRSDKQNMIQLNITIRAGVMARSGLCNGDRVRVFTNPEDASSRVIGVGYAADASPVGWKLCPYNAESEGYDDYEDAMGSHASGTFHFTLSSLDTIPEIQLGYTYEIQDKDIMYFGEENHLRLAFEIPEQ